MKLTEAVKDMCELLERRAREGDLEAYELMSQIDGLPLKRLKECPFCGGQCEVYKDEYKGWVHIRCRECWAETDGCDTLETAISHWNERVETRPQGRWLQHDDEDANAWECSECHNVWQLMDGSPAENGMKYCQRCGAEMALDSTEERNAGNR